jgi:hypothetical protein
MRKTTHRRQTQQKGSALLIVLVFAAMLAIMLYKEIPVATFEAQRQKEELLMDRGNEYKRAIKLYVRKFQTFPPSIDALENTNRMRFLRARYVDPYTGKDDWRLLHAGPGGMITDSKIKLNGAGLSGVPGSNASSSSPLGAPSSVTNPFANSFDGSNPMSTGQAGAGAGYPQRPPAISVNGPPAGAGNPDIMAGMPTMTPDLTMDPLQNGGQPGNPMATSSGPYAGVPGRFRGNPTGSSYPPGQFGGGVNPDGSPITATPNDPQGTMQSLLNNPNPQPVVQNGGANLPPNTGSAFGSNNGSAFGSNNGSAFGSNNNAQNGAGGSQMGAMGNTMGGGIAGVASKSPGRTIKVLNDQTDRSLWEFVYDMQKEAQANAPGGVNNTNGGINGPQPGQSSTFGTNTNFGNVMTNSGPSSPPPQPPNQ